MDMTEKTPKRRQVLKILLGATATLTALSTGLAWWGTRRPQVAFVQDQCKAEGSGKRVLVAYASRAGSTGEIGAAIAKQLCAQGFDVDLREVSTAGSPEQYAAFVLGSAVRYGNWLPEMLKFMQRNPSAMAERPVVYFTACNKARDQSAASITEMKAYSNAARAIAAPRTETFFAGKIDMATLSLLERSVVRLIGSPEGDFRDWAAINAWAQSLAPLFRDLA